jgi:hypothetical protein
MIPIIYHYLPLISLLKDFAVLPSKHFSSNIGKTIYHQLADRVVEHLRNGLFVNGQCFQTLQLDNGALFKNKKERHCSSAKWLYR